MITKKGFTLIELLVVIGILAVLATATALILNPAELLKQSRDSTRVADLASLTNALDLYLSDQSTTWMNGPTNGTKLYSVANQGGCTSGTASKSATNPAVLCVTSIDRTTTGSGWVDVNLNAITTGSPVSRLPLDPNNGSANCGASPANCFYEYIPNETTSKKYELDASMESVKFKAGGTGNIESTDGGDSSGAYEVGTSLVL